MPISKPVFIKKDNSKEAWIKFEVSVRYANAKALKNLPTKFERDMGVQDKYIIRMKKRFNWDKHKPIEERKKALNRYHEKTRGYLFYIYGESNLWYIKKEVVGNYNLANMPSTVLIFGVFHWLSELVRYNSKLFNNINAEFGFQLNGEVIFVEGDLLDPASNKGFIRLCYISTLVPYEIMYFLDVLNLVIEDRSIYCQLTAFITKP